MPLEREIATYHRNLRELLADEGKFVVIHGDEVAGMRDTVDDALQLGYDRFLSEQFLVRQISQHEKVMTFPRSIRPCPSSPAS